jgi:hypothetical protein
MLFTSDNNNYISIASLLLGLVVNVGASPSPSKVSEPPSSAIEASKPIAQPAIAPTVQEMMKLVCNSRGSLEYLKNATFSLRSPTTPFKKLLILSIIKDTTPWASQTKLVRTDAMSSFSSPLPMNGGHLSKQSRMN